MIPAFDVPQLLCSEPLTLQHLRNCDNQAARFSPFDSGLFLPALLMVYIIFKRRHPIAMQLIPHNRGLEAGKLYWKMNAETIQKGGAFQALVYTGSTQSVDSVRGQVRAVSVFSHDFLLG